MARKVTVALQDDLDGSPAEQTVRFALNGDTYEIDLSHANAAAFRAQFTQFIEHARKASPGLARPVATRQRSTAIRAWAKDHGIPVSDRGRIPVTVVEQYEAATTHPSKARA